MCRAMKSLEQEVKKIEIRRDQEGKKHELELELNLARSLEAQQVNNSMKYVLNN